MALSKGPDVKMEFIHGGYFHFFPQTWYCDFEHHLNKYNIITYNSSRDNFVNELERFLEKIKVPEGLRKKVSVVVKERSTLHVSNKGKTNQLLKEIYANKTMYNILYNTYYSDFQVLKGLL